MYTPYAITGLLLLASYSLRYLRGAGMYLPVLRTLLLLVLVFPWPRGGGHVNTVQHGGYTEYKAGTEV